MEDKKDNILKNIKRTESELKLEELSEDQLMQDISRYQTLSTKVCERIHAISWKISQAEFIHSCENKKQINYLCKIRRSNVMVGRFEILKRWENNMSDCAELTKSLSERLELLKRSNVMKKELICNIEKELKVLKKRNDPVFQKLMKEIEEWENEERQLEHKLEQIQYDHERDDFDIY